MQCKFFLRRGVLCTNSTKPILRSIDKEILDISVIGWLVIKLDKSPMNCSTKLSIRHVALSLWGTPFTISGGYNALAVVGCKTAAWLKSNETTSLGGCTPLCDANSTDTTCNGINCCQVPIPSRCKVLEYTSKYIDNSYNDTSSSCGNVFGVEKKWLKSYRSYNELLHDGFGGDINFSPLVLEWEFDKSKDNSFGSCTYSDDHPSEVCNLPYNRGASIPQKHLTFSDYNGDDDEYVSTIKYCFCDQGYEGNPYLPQGCVDIDECDTNKTRDPCGPMQLSCINTNGSYLCVDPNGKSKTRLRMIFIGIGSSLFTVILLLVAWRLNKAIRKIIEAKRRRKSFFKKNGGLLLEQLSVTDSGFDMTKLYSSKELEIATDQYSEDRVLGSGAHGTVYKGVLRDGRIVAIKKSQDVKKLDVGVFINEISILSKVNHRNVVKLLGCCLETEVPLLVYEFISNGTLYQHIHNPNDEFLLTWEMRLSIARQVAASLAYLHSATCAPIYHRDIKSSNILLDDNYHAKVSDFGRSRSVDIDQTHVVMRVLGTYGYMDPGYLQSGLFTEKSDVYSFGVVMAELLTGEKATEGGNSLAARFLGCTEDDQLFEIVDAKVNREGDDEKIIAFARLARRCMQLNRRNRPTMKVVAAELEAIQDVEKSSCDTTEIVEPRDVSLEAESITC